MGFRRFTSSLEMALYTVFRQDIGLKSVICVAPRNFSTNVSIVAFAVAGRKTEAKKFLIDTTTSFPNVSQEVLKKAEVRPSGLGALFGFSL